MPTPTPILIERRFPVGLDVSLPAIRALYEEAKAAHWDPQRDIRWDDLDSSGFSAEVRTAARLTWSRRAWIEYTSLAETPSLLVRFCIERDREADPKLFLTVRNTEEAWHIECCHRIAETLGGYLDRPDNDAYAQSLNQSFHREVLHAETSLDAYVVAHAAISEAIELALWEGYLSNASQPTIQAVLAKSVADKRRHAQFGLRYAEARAANWTDAERREIVSYVQRYISEVELTGYHCAALGPPEQFGPILRAEALTADAGLGALSGKDELPVFQGALERCLDELAKLDLAISTA